MVSNAKWTHHRTRRFSGFCAMCSASPAPSSAAAWRNAAPARCMWTANRYAPVCCRSLPWKVERLPPLKVCRPAAITPCSAPGPSSTSCNVAIVSRDKSCPPQLCWPLRRNRAMPTSTRRSRETSAAAAPTNAFVPPYIAPPNWPKAEEVPMKSAVNVSRRDFIKTSPVAGGGLVIAFVVPGASRFAFAQAAPAGKLPSPNAFLRVGGDDSVTVLLAHSEMGQGIWTTLPMLIAEELDADWGKIKVEHAPAAPPYAHTFFGMQMTGGSSTTWSEFDRYRQAGALARALLVQAAAKRFGVKPAACRTENGEVIAGNKRVRYGQLAAAAAKLTAPKAVKLKDPKEWKIIGKPTRRLDTPEKITGRAQFGMDVQFPGLLTAVVARAARSLPRPATPPARSRKRQRRSRQSTQFPISHTLRWSHSTAR